MSARCSLFVEVRSVRFRSAIVLISSQHRDERTYIDDGENLAILLEPNLYYPHSVRIDKFRFPPSLRPRRRSIRRYDNQRDLRKLSDSLFPPLTHQHLRQNLFPRFLRTQHILR